MENVFFQITDENKICAGSICPVHSVGQFFGTGKKSVCIVLQSGHLMDFPQDSGKFYTMDENKCLRPS